MTFVPDTAYLTVNVRLTGFNFSLFYCFLLPNATQGCGGICTQAGCHHRQQSILQRGLQAGEHQPSQQVCPTVSVVCLKGGKNVI